MLTQQLAAFAELGRLFQQVHFAEPILVTDAAVLRDVQSLLEEETGRLNRVFDLTIDPDTDTFQGKAEQRITLARTQVYQFRITPEQMVYKLVNAADMAEFADTEAGWTEIVEYAAKAGKKLNCKPGNMQCGGKCQSGQKNCFANLSATQKKAAQAAVKAAKAKANPKSKKSAAVGNADAASTQPQNTKLASTKKLNIGPSDGKLEQMEFSKDSSFTKVGDANYHGVEFVRDANNDTFARKRAGNFTGNIAYDTASEVVATNMMRSIGIDNVARVKVQDPSEADQESGIKHYSQFVPGITAKEAGARGQIPLGDDGIMLGKQESFERALEHPDLAKIYAFDLYSFNGDRGGGNLMYDQKNNRYYAIDNEGAFYDTPYRNIYGVDFNQSKRQAIEDGMTAVLSRKALSDQEKTNLREFYQTINQLTQQNPQEIIKNAESVRSKITTQVDKNEEDEHEAVWGTRYDATRREAVEGSHNYAVDLIKRFDADLRRHGVIRDD